MTAIGDVVTQSGDGSTVAVVARRRRLWPRVLAAYLFGLLLALGLAVGALLAWDGGYDGRVLPGVSVGAVDLSGMDQAQAAGALETAYAAYGEGRVVVRTTAGDLTVPYRAFQRRADVAAMVAEAMATGRAGTPLERAVGEVRLALRPVSLSPRVTFDQQALASTVTALVARLDRKPIDSKVILEPEGVRSTPAYAGRTFDGAAAAAAAAATLGTIEAPAEIVVPVSSTEVPPAHGTEEAVAAQTAIERMGTKVVVTLGKRKWTIKAKTVRGWLSLQTAADGSVKPVADEALIAKSLKKVAKAVKRSPVSAKYLKTRGGHIVGVAGATDGRKLDTRATASAIALALVGRGAGAAAEPIKARTISIAPKLTTAEAVKKGPLMHRLGSWKTWFPISDRNSFGANIWLPAKFIDGKVLMPGQRFEWWSAIGPVTTSRGFGMGGFIAGDHTDPTGALGGGMCSSSTTLFNAALRAGLQMGARSNHKYYIYRYPLGLDATVSKTRGGGGQTMSFTNDMKHPVVIRSFRYRSGGRGWVRYEIWGIPEGRKVSLSKPSVANVRKAITRNVYVSNLRHGQREQIEFPANGMDVAVTRTVRAASGRVIHRETYRTHYVLWNGLVHIGR